MYRSVYHRLAAPQRPPEDVMQTIVTERTISVPAQRVWEYLSDLTHFGRHDPFHHDFRFVTPHKSGLGVEFDLRHTYLPIFPLPSDHVRCRVTRWEALRRVSILETNRSRLKSHTQDFELSPVSAGVTQVRFTIIYRGVPTILLPWRMWATWLVQKRMAEKLRQIERECGLNG